MSKDQCKPTSVEHENKKRKNVFLTIISCAGIVLIASNLRSPLSSVGPVLDSVSTDLGLDNTMASFLMTIPLLVFAFLSGLVGRLSVYVRPERLIFISILFLILGLYLRVFGSLMTLFLGSILIGVGICFGNVLMPGFIKQEFPDHLGLMTGIYSVAMNLTAALAAGFSIYIGDWSGHGWKGSLGIWIFLSVIGLIVWIPQFYKKNTPNVKGIYTQSKSRSLIYSKQAWFISLFMGIQSLLYYCLITWLPSVLTGYGMEELESGWVLSYLQLAMLPVTFIGPVIASRLKNQKLFILFLSISMILGLGLLLIYKLEYVYLSAVLFGVSNGLAFSLSMLFFSLRTQSTENAIKLSGMAQSIGYFVASFGPPVFGKLNDITGNWGASFLFLFLSSLGMLTFGWLSARDHYVEMDLKDEK